MLAIVGLVQGVFVVQMGQVLTGLPGVNYLFYILISTWISLSFLMFEGKRFRAFLTVSIFIVLTIPTYVMGRPYDIFPRIPGVLTILVADIVFNSFYKSYKKRDHLLRWCTILSVSFILLDVAFRTLLYPLFYSPEFIATFLNITLLLMPVILIESFAGAYLGIKIHDRVKNMQSFKEESSES